MSRHYVPDMPPVDHRVIYNNATALVVGMMRATEGFSIRNAEDRAIALEALQEAVSSISQAVAEQGSRDYGHGD